MKAYFTIIIFVVSYSLGICNYEFFLCEGKVVKDTMQYINQLLNENVTDSLVPVSDNKNTEELLVASLLKVNPHFIIEKTQTPVSSVSMHTADDGPAVNIKINGKIILISMPFRMYGSYTSELFEEVWKYLKCLHNEFGYIIYDKQIRKIVDIADSFSENMNTYMKSVNIIFR